MLNYPGDVRNFVAKCVRYDSVWDSASETAEAGPSHASGEDCNEIIVTAFSQPLFSVKSYMLDSF